MPRKPKQDKVEEFEQALKEPYRASLHTSAVCLGRSQNRFRRSIISNGCGEENFPDQYQLEVIDICQQPGIAPGAAPRPCRP